MGAQIERGLGRTVATVIRAGFDDRMGSRYEHQPELADYLRGRTRRASSPPDANSSINLTLSRSSEAMTAVEALPTRSHTTLGGGP